MKRLAIFLDGGGEDAATLDATTRLARGLDARLDVYRRAPGPMMASSLAGDSFGFDPHAGINGASPPMAVGESVRWIELSGRLDDAIHHYGLVYDAVVVARLTDEGGASARAFNTALFEVGVPILIMPPQAPEAPARRIALVWTGTPQSARAMRAAVPLLRRADDVHVLTNSDNEMAHPDEAMDYLSDHGISAASTSFTGAALTARGRGRAIIEAVRGLGVDLMVMGAFGEGRRDVLFGLGRTTRKLVTAAPVCLLLQS